MVATLNARGNIDNAIPLIIQRLKKKKPAVLELINNE